VTSIDARLALAFKHVATAERMTLLIEQAAQMVNGIKRIHESDDELAPELRTAIDSLDECVQALIRAHEFSVARLEVASESG
jgi:uncharacterized protein with PhoU and TrkA domain